MKLKNMMYISLFAAIIGVLGFFPPILLPLLPVPVTLQTLGVMLAGGILGARRGGLSLLLFLLLVIIGLPLLSGGRGGAGILVGPTGGFFLCWPIAAWIVGFMVEKYWHTLNVGKVFLFNVIAGVLLINLSGATFLSLTGELPWLGAATSTLIFIPGDLLKAGIASYVTVQFNKRYPVIDQPKPAKQTSFKGVS